MCGLGHLLQRLRHVTERPSAQSCSCHSAYTFFPASCTLDAQVVTFSPAVDWTARTTAAHRQSRSDVSKERQLDTSMGTHNFLLERMQ